MVDGLEPLQEQKEIPLEQQLSVQERATRAVTEDNAGTPYGLSFMLLADTGNLAPYWWSWAREQYLARNWQKCPLYAGAVFNIGAKLSTIPPIIEPRDPTLKSERERAEEFAVKLYEGSEFGVGWLEFAMKWFQDRWCLAGPSHIHLGGERRGQTKTIAKMVKERDPGPVLSVDGGGRIVERAVIEWHKTPLGDRRWWWISLANVSFHSGKKRGGLFLTEDHPVLTENGWLEARDVKVGMRVATGDPVPNEKQSQMLVGAILGDASVGIVRKRAMLRFGHSVKQEEWLDCKLDALRGFDWTGRNVQEQPNDKYLKVSINSRASMGLVSWREGWYPNGKKVVNRPHVERYFSPLMMATWYCDDGSLKRDYTRAGNPTSCSMMFWTNSFSVEDVEWLVNLLNKKGFPAKLRLNRREYKGKEKIYPVIYITCEGTRKLVEYMGAYIPPPMRYKLPDGAPDYQSELWDLGISTIYYDEVVESRERTHGSGYRAVKTTYHLGVEETRNYVAANMLVHNTSDNGAFAEVLGKGRKDGPIIGAPVGLANLDSNLCSRTGHAEWPVVYRQELSGKKFKLHRSRVIYGAQLPSTRDRMNGVGLSWFSRCMGVAQSIVDDLTYKQEKMGGRPRRSVLVGKKMSVSMVKAAFEMADEAADNAGLTRMSFTPVVANESASDVGIDVVDLASLPDGFEWETDVNLAMYIIALTGGFPVRWMWPATAVGATKADSLLQHMATAMSGAAHELNTLALLLGGSQYGPYHQRGKFLPASLKMRFDVQDDWIDQVQSEIHNTRAMAHERNLGDGAVTVRVVREQMLCVGEITEAQFREMELEDGRTQDGLPVDVLFYGDNPYLQGIDPDDFVEAEIKEKLKEAKRASVNDSGERRTLAKEAVAALEWLLEPDEEEEERPDVAKPHEDAPMRKLPEMTSTGVTDGFSASSEKERPPIERKMQADINKALREVAPEAEMAVVEGEEPDYEPLRVALATIITTHLIRAFMDMIEWLESEYDISFDPADMAAAANEWASTYAQAESARLIGTTQKVVSGVAAKYAAGEITRDQIEEMLDPAFNKSRAALIAITLITVARSIATDNYVDSLRGMGLEVIERWYTQEDERVCSACAPLHGQPREVWGEPPPRHGRCRCYTTLEIVGL